ncbi:hypothetical protein [Xanthomonas bonasiae]|uniref:hypothetical protein n=1 Tax=Xanthomonas bonasiae TaxID=2810351 RepID=UPI001786FB44|nr:hypothetical protein [Xanthomonas surreyensis]MBD7923740.1 hypothetical protein [Xanthomonas surreyensis]
MAASQSVDWNLLQHAYGDASDLPALLRKIERFPAEPDWQSEPWFSLWSALYHQGDIYSASIAAVPRIVSTLSEAPNKATLSFYLLPASIAIADNANPIAAPATIRESFTQALAVLGGIAAASLPSASDEDLAKAMQAAVLVWQGDFQQAAGLLELEI